MLTKNRNSLFEIYRLTKKCQSGKLVVAELIAEPALNFLPKVSAKAVNLVMTKD
jgi:hypothetical protein